jgi:hypothetical protein
MLITVAINTAVLCTIIARQTLVILQADKRVLKTIVKRNYFHTTNIESFGKCG